MISFLLSNYYFCPFFFLEKINKGVNSWSIKPVFLNKTTYFMTKFKGLI